MRAIHGKSSQAKLSFFICTPCFLILQNIPNGNYEYKITIGGSWAVNYGVNGSPDGANIVVNVVNGPSDILVEFDPTTNIPSHYFLVNGEKVIENTDESKMLVFEMDDPLNDEWGSYPTLVDGK